MRFCNKSSQLWCFSEWVLLNAFLNLLNSTSCVPILFSILLNKVCTTLCHMCCKTGKKKQYNTWKLLTSHPTEIKYLRLNHAEKISYKKENPFFGISPQQELVYRGNLFPHICEFYMHIRQPKWSLILSWAEDKSYFLWILLKISFSLRNSQLEQCVENDRSYKR